ncbi:3-methyl-2-oxobutanoate hydroxymethyltransferase [Streptomyces sp. NPDC002928]|uniref:3-methyl-2-oxobutanoate hydroxymethyltransferase n=1 Tax=Streptomyces sp. NPDC002928 TaxID=3154440 RepID=UPI0033BB0F6A
MREDGKSFVRLAGHLAGPTFLTSTRPGCPWRSWCSRRWCRNTTSLPVTVDEMIPLVRAVSRSARRALAIADLPFGSCQASPEQCFHTAVRFMKEAGAHAVKLEGGEEMVPQVELLPRSGIPVMAHIGFTLQHEHGLGGDHVQSRGADAHRVIASAKALEAAGAFALLLEMVPGELAAETLEAEISQLTLLRDALKAGLAGEPAVDAPRSHGGRDAVGPGRRGRAGAGGARRIEGHAG